MSKYQIMKKIAISQSNYIPWKGYFDLINSVDEFILYDDVQYTKRDWRNRNKIMTPQGPKWLSIPVEVKGKYFQSVRETMVADSMWPNKHWKSIQQNYSSTSGFDHYGELFANVYLNQTETHLSKINFQFIKVVCDILEIPTKITFSMDYHFERSEKNQQLIELCRQAEADVYFSGPAAKDYMEIDTFNKHGIEVTFFDYSDYPVYNQLYSPFEHSVSILDLLFCEGRNAKKFMKTFSQ